MDRMKEVTGFNLIECIHLSVSERIHPVNPVHPVAGLLFLAGHSAPAKGLFDFRSFHSSSPDFSRAAFFRPVHLLVFLPIIAP